MAINYAKIFNRRATPQSQPIPGSSQVRNSGGGFSWQVDGNSLAHFGQVGSRVTSRILTIVVRSIPSRAMNGTVFHPGGPRLQL